MDSRTRGIGLAVCLGLLACGRQPAASAGAPDPDIPELETTKPADATRLERAEPKTNEEAALLERFYIHRKGAAPDYEHLAATLGTSAPVAGPEFDVTSARYFDEIAERLQLTPAQREQLQQRGAISLATGGRQTMGGIYASLWQAELPAFITTDSILHAWHKTYDNVLQQKEISTFSGAYRDLLAGINEQLLTELGQPSPKLLDAATHLELYLCVARTLLEPPDERSGWSSEVDTEPPSAVGPHLAKIQDVETIVRAAYSQQVTDVPRFGEVDFTQFKPRGHYTNGVGLARYFRAVMWMGRADTGFDIRSLHATRIALMLAVLAEHSGKLPAFEKVQAAIDYFVGSSNGLPLVKVAQVVRRAGVKSLTELEDDARVEALRTQLLVAASPTRVTSQPEMSAGRDTPAPLVFQLSNQRFTIDSFVHQRVSFDRIAGRTMVDGLDVFAAMGNAEATRLLKPDLVQYAFSADMHALQTTIAELSPGYWQTNIYTRWFDALRTLHRTPEGPELPDFFRAQTWQRKQLNNQLASWAELRRDTILYVAQVYSSILCDFPEVYLEPYPDFYDRIHDMALEAQTRLDEKYAFGGFIDVMGKLSDIARRELTIKGLNPADQTFLKALVKRHVSGGGCGGPTIEWTGWYRHLYPAQDMFDFEPVIADVFTDPNSGRVLNAATAAPEMMVLTFQTSDGPTVFAGPVASYRQFVGGRMNDEEWEAIILRGGAPPAPGWYSLSAGKGVTPKPHE